MESYEKASGLARLEVGEERTKKTETACAAGLFAACAYMVRKLAGHRADEVEGLSFEVSEPASVGLKSKREAGDPGEEDEAAEELPADTVAESRPAMPAGAPHRTHRATTAGNSITVRRDPGHGAT